MQQLLIAKENVQVEGAYLLRHKLNFNCTMVALVYIVIMLEQCGIVRPLLVDKHSLLVFEDADVAVVELTLVVDLDFLGALVEDYGYRKLVVEFLRVFELGGVQEGFAVVLGLEGDPGDVLEHGLPLAIDFEKNTVIGAEVALEDKLTAPA